METAALKQKCEAKSQFQTIVESLFSPDQVRFLKLNEGGKKSGFAWSNQTIKKALQIRFACGSAGYECLLQVLQFPLPSIRTLQHRTEHLQFNSGILPEVFELLKIKASTMPEKERLCSLSMDEFSVKSSVEYDQKSDKFIGEVDLPDHDGIATKCLVFQLAGITVRFKQICGYFFTGNSVNGKVIGPIINEIIEEASKAGLLVKNVTSDMGASNQACWK